jgi:hypothetical protein
MGIQPAKLTVDLELELPKVYDRDGDLEQPTSWETAIVESAARQLLQMLDDKAKAALINTVTERVAADIEKKMLAEVDKVLAEGFQKTNTWGSADGPRRTLKEMVLAQLEAKRTVGDYNNRKNVLVIEAHAEAAAILCIEKEFKPIVEEAKAKFRAAVDGLMAQKLQDTLKSALGLK